jgi:hypothetical protein
MHCRIAGIASTIYMKMKEPKLCLLLVFAAALLLQGCESTPEKSGSSQPAAQQFETGRFALQKMIAPARLWAADAQPIRLLSSTGKDNTGHDGKSAYWGATFAAPSRQKADSFSWSGLVGPDAPPRGVDHGPERSFDSANRSTQPFDLAFLKVDSDRAFEVAQQHGGKQLLEKDPNQPVLYLLDWGAAENQLRWHVIYGPAENNSKLSVVVDASTGDFTHKE